MDTAAPPTAILYDGRSNTKHQVVLYLSAALNIAEDGRLIASWPLQDVRRQDAGDGVLRLSVISNALARLEINDADVQAKFVAACPNLYGEGSTGVVSNRQIVGWSLAAAASIIAIIIYGVPLLASSLAPLVPHSVEKRIGQAVDGQVRTMFGGKDCTKPDGVTAFNKLMASLQSKAKLRDPPNPVVMSSKVPNAFALPGGNVYLLDGLLQKAENPDEVAGVLAHEIGHVAHRDGLKALIQNGGTSFLAGLLFGDVTGAGVVLTLGRTLIDAHYSRDAESAADAFAIQVMGELGRSPKPLGDLLLRITGPEKDDPTAIFASHPITADRVATFEKANVAVTGPEILSKEEWQALKTICK